VSASEILAASTGRRATLLLTSIAILAACGGGYWYWMQGPSPAQAARPAARPAVPV